MILAIFWMMTSREEENKMIVKNIMQVLMDLKSERDKVENAINDRKEKGFDEDPIDRKHLDALNLAISLIEGDDD